MKNLAMAGAVAAALSLTALSQQRAAAQDCPQQCMRGGDVSLNAGITFGAHWTPCHGHWEPNCCGPYGCPIGPYGYAAGPYGSRRRPSAPAARLRRSSVAAPTGRRPRPSRPPRPFRRPRPKRRASRTSATPTRGYRWL